MRDIKPQVKLVGKDENIFSIMARVTDAMKHAGYSKDERDAYVNEVTACHSYATALQVTIALLEQAEEDGRIEWVG